MIDLFCIYTDLVETNSVADPEIRPGGAMTHDRGGSGGARAPLTTKNEAPAPKFYKIKAPEWQF